MPKSTRGAIRKTRVRTRGRHRAPPLADTKAPATQSWAGVAHRPPSLLGGRVGLTFQTPFGHVFTNCPHPSSARQGPPARPVQEGPAAGMENTGTHTPVHPYEWTGRWWHGRLGCCSAAEGRRWCSGGQNSPSKMPESRPPRRGHTGCQGDQRCWVECSCLAADLKLGRLSYDYASERSNPRCLKWAQDL